ncbi:amidophosphoribosyltransferase [Sulfitobacter alexandrii]|uniref:Amidophosphoribosyltransferase n=1 Tax=Sulfitobacter alexandrii TaxID=1917485 RepID=A0A1J0WLD0_9RHOB|nr:double zinc ribbon domain-containing protein [Sulfitobacter alexandrii]APE45148.1 amidophosphoribosyltransferase [Sulfitobacter alexandrii]
MPLRERLQTALNAIYPARCLACGDVVDTDFGLCGPCWTETAFIGGTVCDSCGIPLPGIAAGDTLACDACLQTPRPWERGRAAVLYTATGRKLVLALKHGDRQEIARPAGRWMAQATRSLLDDDALIAPIPLHWRRMLRRRYNQSALLARVVARETGRRWCADLLQRYRATPSLDGMGREERFRTLKDAIRLNPRHAVTVRDRPVLLVDDVMTSGATFAAAAEACRAAGSGPVCVVALARVAKDT